MINMTYQISKEHNLDVKDITEEGKAFKVQQLINKNYELLTDEILGRKKHYDKSYSSPLDPNYIVSTNSKRIMILGPIDDNKPRQLIKKEVRKDTKRCMRIDDIQGAQPKESDLIPQDKLPQIHPTYQDGKGLQAKQLLNLRLNYGKRNRESDNMSMTLAIDENQREKSYIIYAKQSDRKRSNPIIHEDYQPIIHPRNQSLRLKESQLDNSIQSHSKRHTNLLNHVAEISVNSKPNSFQLDKESFNSKIIGKFGGPSFAPSSKDYGNFLSNQQIDQLIQNVRQISTQELSRSQVYQRLKKFYENDKSRSSKQGRQAKIGQLSQDQRSQLKGILKNIKQVNKQIKVVSPKKK
eukprot:403358665